METALEASDFERYAPKAFPNGEIVWISMECMVQCWLGSAEQNPESFFLAYV